MLRWADGYHLRYRSLCRDNDHKLDIRFPVSVKEERSDDSSGGVEVVTGLSADLHASEEETEDPPSAGNVDYLGGSNFGVQLSRSCHSNLGRDSVCS